MKPWFEIDKEGLTRVLERRGKAAALFELVQNGWDEDGVTRLDVMLEPVTGKPFVSFRVEDDAPEGFADMAYAYTFFKASKKVHDPEKRGRFSIGEKLVLGLCVEATVSSTRGTVVFGPDGGRYNRPRLKREAGSVVEGTLRMTRSEMTEALAQLQRLISPEGIVTTVNGERLLEREKLTSFGTTLQTEIADEDGYLRTRYRWTDVDVYEPREGEVAALYELGIPVVETRDRWSVDVRQKVPVSLDRASIVTPTYLRDVRVAVLNHMASQLEAAEATEGWVSDAMDDSLVSAEALGTVLDLRFGKRRVVYDPSDPEANRIATARGYTVIPGRALSKDAWERVRKHEVALPAGRVTPSPKPFSRDGKPLTVVPESAWDDGIRNLVAYAEALHERVHGSPLSVVVTRDQGWRFMGAYREGLLYVHAGKLKGRQPSPEVDRFLIHEFAHRRGGHLSESFDDELARIGAAMTELARQEPEFYNQFRMGHMNGGRV